MEERSCLDCKYCLTEDEGYSSWTVENTIVHCLKKAHPNTPFDRFYGSEPQLKYASDCSEFKRGVYLKLDVDREGASMYNAPLSSWLTDDEELKILLNDWE